MHFCSWGCFDKCLAKPTSAKGHVVSMGEAPSRCCRSERCERTIKDREEEEASGDETVWPDNTSDVGSKGQKMPSLNSNHIREIGNPGLSEQSAEQGSLEVRSNNDESPIPRMPKSVCVLQESEDKEELAKKRREKKADTLYRLRNQKSFDSDAHTKSEMETPFPDEEGEEDNVENLINNLTSNIISRPDEEKQGVAQEGEYAKILMRSNSAMRSFKHHQASLDRIVWSLQCQRTAAGPL